MRVMPLRLALTCVAATIAISLTACVSAPSQEARSAPPSASAQSARALNPRELPLSELRKVGVQSFQGSVIINVGDYHCAEGSHKYHDTYGDCDAIPVVVLLKPAGGCVALIPYADLWIHTDKKKVKLTWQIIGPKNYVFNPNTAMPIDPLKDGIAITKVTNTTDPTNPSDNYNGKAHGGRKFSWELKQDALTPRAFYHYANVNDPNGNACEPIDPGMINLVN